MSLGDPLILTPSPLQWRSNTDKKESEQKVFDFIDETPETKLLPFMTEKGKGLESPSPF